MPKQNEKDALVDEIIDNASRTPLEYQEWLLAVAKGMAFSKSAQAGEKAPADG